MATTVFGTNHNQAVKLWKKVVAEEMLANTQFWQFAGDGNDNAIQISDENSKNKGDNVHCTLIMTPTGRGVTGDDSMENNEEALSTFRDTLVIDQLRNAVKSDGEMSEQRIIWNFNEKAAYALGKWMGNRFDEGAANQASGNTDVVDTAYTGLNATIAPSSLAGNTRILYGDGTCTTENSLSVSSSYFTLANIDRCVLTAEIASPLIAPAQTPYGKKFIFIAHPNVIYRMRTDATANQVNWYNTHLALLQGGMPAKESMIFSPGYEGFVGEYNNTLIFSNKRMPIATGTTAVRRCVFMGAGAQIAGFGAGYGIDAFKWVTAMGDYNNQTGVAVGSIYGNKKTVYNSIDYGNIVLSVYAP